MCDYRTERVQVELGIKQMQLTIAELSRRKAAESIDIGTAHSMVSLNPLGENMVILIA